LALEYTGCLLPRLRETLMSLGSSHGGHPFTMRRGGWLRSPPFKRDKRENVLHRTRPPLPYETRGCLRSPPFKRDKRENVLHRTWPPLPYETRGGGWGACPSRGTNGRMSFIGHGHPFPMRNGDAWGARTLGRINVRTSFIGQGQNVYFPALRRLWWWVQGSSHRYQPLSDEGMGGSMEGRYVKLPLKLPLGRYEVWH
jgi:hypothetical protein